MRKYKVICTQVSGIGKLLFNYGQEATEEQLINPAGLVKSGAIVEIESKETKEESKKEESKTESKEEVKTDEAKKETKEESKK